MDLLFAIRDLGLPDPLPDGLTIGVRAALIQAIEAGPDASASRPRWRRFVRRSTLIPVALVVTSAVAAAATGLLPLQSPQKFARHNISDSPLTLFRKSVPYQGGRMVGKTLVPFTEVVIPSSVRMISEASLPGVGRVQFWVAITKQHGYCTALRLPGGGWAGMRNQDIVGSIPGCQPTRRQVGWGTLILSGFDYNDDGVTGRRGARLLIYGQIVAPGHPAEVRDQSTGTTGPVIDGKYFVLDERYSSLTGDSNLDLVALNASGKVIANEHKPLPGTPTVKCVGRYDVRRAPVPGTKKMQTSWQCRHYVQTIEK